MRRDDCHADQRDPRDTCHESHVRDAARDTAAGSDRGAHADPRSQSDSGHANSHSARCRLGHAGTRDDPESVCRRGIARAVRPRYGRHDR